MHLPVALVAPKSDEVMSETDTCPDCGHAPSSGRWSALAAVLRPRRSGICREQLQVIYDEDDVRCGCRNEVHSAVTPR